MRPILIYITLLAIFTNCRNASKDFNIVKDTSLVVRSTSLPNDEKFLSLVVNGDTTEYPFKFTKNSIRTIYPIDSSLQLVNYLDEFHEIIPYYLREINDSTNFGLKFDYKLISSYPYKFDRIKLQEFFNKKNINNTYTNGILNTALEYSNLKTDIERVLPQGYFVKRFSSEKVDFNISDFKRNIKGSNSDSIEFSEKPFIGMLWIKIEKHK